MRRVTTGTLVQYEQTVRELLYCMALQCGGTFFKVGRDRQRLPRHPPHCGPSFLNLHGIKGRGVPATSSSTL